MKSLRENKHINKPLIITAASILILAVAATVYVYAFNGNLFGWTNGRNDDSSTKHSPATKEQKEAGDRQKEATVNNAEKPSGNSDAPEQAVEQPNGTQTVSVTITAANQTANTLQIRALVAAVHNQGECTLTLEKSGRQPVVKTASVQPLANASTCQGFDVPIYELAAGTWSITLDFKNGTTSGRATSTINIT